MKLSSVVALLFLPVVSAEWGGPKLDPSLSPEEKKAELKAYLAGIDIEPAPKEEQGLLGGMFKYLNDVRTCGCGGCTCSAEGGVAFTSYDELYRAIREVARLDDANDPKADVYLTYGCPMLIWDVSFATDMAGLFYGYDGEDFGNLDNWNVSNVLDMSQMFYASNFNGGVAGWDVSSVTSMSEMFASGAEFSGPASFNQPLFSWDTSKVTDMSGMFQDNKEFNQPLSGASIGTKTPWDTSKVKDFSNMFNGATSFNQDVSNFDLSAATSIRAMFQGATLFNQDLCDWISTDGMLTDPNEVENAFAFTRCNTFANPDVTGEGPYCYGCVPPSN